MKYYFLSFPSFTVQTLVFSHIFSQPYAKSDVCQILTSVPCVIWKNTRSGGITIPPGYYVLYYCGIMSKMYPKTWKRTLWKCIALWNCHNDHLRRISGEALNNWLVLEGLSHMNRIKDLFWNQIFYFQIVFWTNHLLYFNDICWQGKRRIVFLSAQQRQK